MQNRAQICPRCRFANRFGASFCQQCGGKFERASSAPVYREARSANKTGNNNLKAILPLILLGIILITAAQWMAQLDSSDEVVTGGSGTAVGTDTTGNTPSLTSGGLFTERESKTVTPKVLVNNMTRAHLNFQLEGNGGKNYQIWINPWDSAELTVESGEYTLYLTGSDGNIPSRTGVAVFKKYTEYEASFVLESLPYGVEQDPLRIGDE